MQLLDCRKRSGEDMRKSTQLQERRISADAEMPTIHRRSEEVCEMKTLGYRRTT
jgi:hypothetical protein